MGVDCHHTLRLYQGERTGRRWRGGGGVEGRGRCGRGVASVGGVWYLLYWPGASHGTRTPPIVTPPAAGEAKMTHDTPNRSRGDVSFSTISPFTDCPVILSYVRHTPDRGRSALLSHRCRLHHRPPQGSAVAAPPPSATAGAVQG